MAEGTKPDPDRTTRKRTDAAKPGGGATRRDSDAQTGAGTASETDAERAERTDETPLTQQVGRIALAVVAVLFGIFAVANSQYVEFSWLFGETQVVERAGERVSGGVPLIVLLLASFVIGALVGWFATWRAGRRR